MADTIGLTGDLDDVETLRSVEDLFGMKVTDREAEQTLTVGQLYDLIESKTGGRTEVCLSQLAFYRLRRAFRELGIAAAVTPATPVSVVRNIQPHSIHASWKTLTRQSTLELPALEAPCLFRPVSLPKWPTIAVLSVLGFATLVVWLDVLGLPPWILFVLLFAMMPLVAGLDFLRWRIVGDIPRRVVTIGDLAREAAGHSFGELSRGRKTGPSDRWFALLALLRQISGYQPKIARDTTFFAQ